MSEVWGPIYWTYLHMVTKKYPDKPSHKEKKYYFNTIQSFINTIPCSTCNEHTDKIINDADLKTALDNKVDFEKYIWDIHNQVNKRLNKKIMKFDTFNKTYNKILDKTYSSNLIKLIKANYFKNSIIVVLFIFLIITKIILIHIILKTKFKFKKFKFLNNLIMKLFHDK